MRIICATLLVAAASGADQFPGFWPGVTKSYTPTIEQPKIEEAKCDEDQSFFQGPLQSALLEHPEFSEDKVKIALGKSKMKFMHIDQPFSQKANAIAMSFLEETPAAAEEDPMAEKRRAIRRKKAWSGSRIKQAEAARAAELRQEMMRKQDDKDRKIDVWYVNMDTAKERRTCLERQFKDMPEQVQPNRFAAVRFPEACAKEQRGKDYEACLDKFGLKDCIEAGIDYGATGTHGTRDQAEGKIRNAVISNWCGHKRLFKQIEDEAKNNTDHAKYVVLLEDDVIVDRKWFYPVLQDFATKYENRDWDFVQIDPFGHKDKKDLLGHFRGKPVFKPASDGQCSAYWGFHAVLVKVSALPRINHWMKLNQAIPIDWLPWRMPHGLSYSALVSRNPEAALNGNVIVLPQYCSAKVMKSTIG